MTSNDTNDSNNKLTIPQSDGWDCVPPERERLIKHRIIKFRDGAYFINRDEPIPGMTADIFTCSIPKRQRTTPSSLAPMAAAAPSVISPTKSPRCVAPTLSPFRSFRSRAK